MATRDDIVTAVRKWIGVPFAHQGRADRAIDCAGLVERIAIELKLVPDDYVMNCDYSREPDEQMKMYLDTVLDKKSKNKREPGTILFFGYTERRTGQHLGIMTYDNIFVHAYSLRGKVIESRLDDRWKKRLIAAYDFRGLE